ncbi:MAG: ATP-dependent Clp protease ATP-binding subunit [Oscillospiraceae bacterium]|nr:ATP-dependent Clp protease ATP-binding subunit [Oscillospiraceae bacterium]
MNNKFTPAAQAALNAALSVASAMGHTYVGSEHLLLGLLSQTEAAAATILAARTVTEERVRELITGEQPPSPPSAAGAGDMTPRTRGIIERSSHFASSNGSSAIGTEHILLALIADANCVAHKIIDSLSGSVKEIHEDTLSYMNSNSGKGERASAPPSKGGKTLEKYSRDLTHLAQEGKIDPIIGRNSEMDRVIQILSRRTKNNPCLIGEPGVGKTAVAEGLAQRIVDKNVPETLLDKRIITLDLTSMIAGAKYRGEFEERLKSIMEEVREDSRIVLFIDEIHTIIGAGAAEGAVDAANIIKPALSRGEMQVIGATTLNEYRKHIEKDAALERRFQPVEVGEPTSDEAVQILFGLREKYQAHHRVTITDEAVESAVALSVRYINDRFLPDKAIDLIDEACSKKRMVNYTMPTDIRGLEEQLAALSAEKADAIKAQDFETAAGIRDREVAVKAKLATEQEQWAKNKESTQLIVCQDDIADIVTAWTGIPVSKLADSEGERLVRLEDDLRSRVIGQDEAVATVARAIRRGRMGLSDPRRPMGSFIFLGPTGVGKTELAKSLCELLFGNRESMIRLDMSEYMEKHTVSKLIGSPPGYVGYDEGGQLTEKIRRRPYSVVLLDELEKAHPDVTNILLQILEDGMLTDAQGRRVDFRNCVIIMTSNVGATSLFKSNRAMGFNADNSESDSARDKVLAQLKETFRPEFLNRIDEIAVFDKLNQESIGKITSIMLEQVAVRVAGLGFDLSFTPAAVQHIAQAGFDPVYGARPLRRAITRQVEDALSLAILGGEITAPTTIVADVADEKIVFKS